MTEGMCSVLLVEFVDVDHFNFMDVGEIVEYTFKLFSITNLMHVPKHFWSLFLYVLGIAE